MFTELRLCPQSHGFEQQVPSPDEDPVAASLAEVELTAAFSDLADPAQSTENPFAPTIIGHTTTLPTVDSNQNKLFSQGEAYPLANNGDNPFQPTQFRSQARTIVSPSQRGQVETSSSLDPSATEASTDHTANPFQPEVF